MASVLGTLEVKTIAHQKALKIGQSIQSSLSLVGQISLRKALLNASSGRDSSWSRLKGEEQPRKYSVCASGVLFCKRVRESLPFSTAQPMALRRKGEAWKKQ